MKKKVYNLTAALLCFTMLFSVASYGANNPEETVSETEKA